MAQPSKVEFPGQKRRMRMRGTKKANVDTQNRMRKNLDRLLKDPSVAFPEIRYNPKSGLFKKDLVEQSIREIEKVVAKKDDAGWLAKRMMAKRGDMIARALAGSLVASHGSDLSTVSSFNHPSFGKASFMRKGEGKPLYLAGIQNFHNPRLRMLPWEDHARSGWFFFSWKGGFVCSGKTPVIPEGWLSDVLRRSRFSLEENEGVFHSSGLQAELIKESKMCGSGYVKLQFIDGSIVAISLDEFAREGEASFIHHLALSMLPPNLVRVMDVEAVWEPEGAEGCPMLEEVEDAKAKVLDAWVGLTINEGQVALRIQSAVRDHIDGGILVNDSWFSSDNISGALEGLSGSDSERRAAEVVLEQVFHNGGGVVISSRNEDFERIGSAIEVRTGSLNGLLSSLWEEYGMFVLEDLGLSGGEAEKIHAKQMSKGVAFGKFFRELDSTREKVELSLRFPHPLGAIDGPVGVVHDLVMTSQLEGFGIAEKLALSEKKDVERMAGGWAWLSAAGRSKGKEWKFDRVVLDRASGWIPAATSLQKAGEGLLSGEDVDYVASLQELHRATGQQQPLP